MGGGAARLTAMIVSFLLALACFANAAAKSSSFTPADSYLISCGSPDSVVVDDGRTFKSDPQSASYLSTDEDILASVGSIPKNVVLLPFPSSSFLPLYSTARIFNHESMYRFLVFKPGRHWLRLYFYPVPHPSYNLSSATFTVTVDDTVLLHGFSVKNDAKTVFKEYLFNVTSDEVTLRFGSFQTLL